jgi:hypothetical protein
VCLSQNFPRSYTSGAKMYLVVPGRGNVTMEGVVMCDGAVPLCLSASPAADVRGSTLASHPPSPYWNSAELG